MAIQANRRKRKYDEAAGEQQDEGELAVPKKVSKESHTPKKGKKGENVEALQENNKDQEVVDKKKKGKGKVMEDNDGARKKKSKSESAKDTTDDGAEDTDYMPRKKSKEEKPDGSEQEDMNVSPRKNTKNMRSTSTRNTTGEPDADLSLNEADNSPDSGVGPEEAAVRFSNDFKMLEFRNKLRGNNFITELRHFLHLCQTRPKIVAKYIEKRGKPLELASAFERLDKTNVLHVGYLCEAFQRVVMEILSNQKSHMESAMHGCRYFLKVHGAVLEQLLQSPNSHHRRCALKLLTAIVCVEPQLGRQVLSSYELLSNVKIMEEMLSHSKADYKDEDTVRKAFIHFVLAFVVDGNMLLIRNILYRGQLIGVLAKGLVYDDHVTVCVVLNTLRQFVLECPDISKTQKIHVFDLECCKNLRRLYDWQGPGGLALHFSGKRAYAKNVQELVKPEELEAVSAAVHKFLMVLLTSRKYGISFDAMTHYRQKHNTLQGKLLGSLYKPFANERKSELITATLAACPELARHTVRNFAGLLNPLRTPPLELPKACDFLGKVIGAVTPRTLAAAMEKMTLTDFTYWMKEVCLPIESLLYITSKSQLKAKSYEMRISVNRLLLTMMTQYSSYVSAVAKREQSKRAGNPLRRFRFELLNHLLVNFPTIESILYSLYMSIQDQQNCNVLEHLSVSLDLVLIMCKENRAFVNKTSQILDYLEVLRPLYETNFDELQLGKQNEQKISKIKLELKSIKTILLLFPRALQPRSNLFSKVFRSFVKAYLLGDEQVQMESGELLHRLFESTGIFEGCDYEIDLWLEALHGFNASIVDNVIDILLTVFQLDLEETPLPQLEVAELESNVQNLRKLFSQIEEGHTIQAYVEMLTLSKLLPLILHGVDIAPPYDAYIELVCVLLFHYHTKPEYVQQLYAGHLQTHNTYMLTSLNKETTKDMPLMPKSVGDQFPMMSKLYYAFLKEPKSFEEIFKPDDSLHFELQLSEGQRLPLHHSLRNQQRNMLYVQQLLFLVSQLVAKQLLTATHAQLAADYIIKLLQIAVQMDEECNSSEELENGQEKTYTQRLLHYIYVIRLSQVRGTLLFSETSVTMLHYVRFLRRVTEYCCTLPDFDSYTGNYRLQLMIALEIGLKMPEQEMAVEPTQFLESVRLVETLNLSADECVQMLNLLSSKLKAADYFTAGKSAHYFELLLHLLQRITKLQQPVDCPAAMLHLRECYLEYCAGDLAEILSEQQLEQLEDALCEFLRSYHHHIAMFDEQFFSCFFATNRKVSKAAIRLASLLLQRNSHLATKFCALLSEHLEQKELIYPLLDIALSKNYAIDNALLQRCYQLYKNGVLKSIEKPQKAAVIYREHATASAALIAHCMPKSECLDYCQKQLKFDAVELFQMRALHEIYVQAFAAAKDASQQAMIFVNYVNLNVQMLTVDLKKQNVELPKLEQLAYNLYVWWQQHSTASEELRNSLDWSRLHSAPQWLNFCKSTLKLGMQMDQENSQIEEDYSKGLILKLLAYLCDYLYVNYNDEMEQQETPALLYEMVCSHSCFLDHLLNYSTSSPSAVKTHILQLLETLARKAPQALQATHIPILLGAYQARLTPADRYTLALLEHYEHYDVGLSAYRPFIWGESAVAFYALRATEDERGKLQQQDTSVAQVLSLIMPQTSHYTIENFPIWRSLQASAQLPDVEFFEPDAKAQRFGANWLERQVEQGHLDLPQTKRRLCPKREELYERCYDPAFMIPLMLHCFAPESVVRALWPVQNGLLALSFCGLSSLDKNMRLAAGLCQQRYRAHFEAAKFYERPLWTQAYDNIQMGLNELRESWLAQRRTHGGTPRVPLIPTLFIARTFNLSTDPTHLLYKPLMLYLRLKQSFNFQTIPEFNVLFYSQEVEHQQYREFIVEVLSSGIKCSADLFLLVSTNTFKVLLCFYGCSVSTLDTNLLILSVLSTCVKIPGAVKIMLEHVGIISWLVGIVGSTEFYQFDIIEGIISIINNLWYALVVSREELTDFEQIKRRLHRLVVQVIPLLSPRISTVGLARLLNVLNKTATDSRQFSALSAQQLDLLLDCLAKHWPDQLASVRYIRNFGSCGASTHSQYCKWLANEQHLDMVGVQALSSLRAYVSGWCLSTTVVPS